MNLPDANDTGLLTGDRIVRKLDKRLSKVDRNRKDAIYILGRLISKWIIMKQGRTVFVLASTFRGRKLICKMTA